LSLLFMGVGTIASALASSVSALAIMRILTGVGIGSALTGVNVLVAEYSSDKRRSLAISLMTIGYPVGATLGGFFSIHLIGAYGWRSVYIFATVVAALLIALVLPWLPESIEYLIVRRPRNALAKVNRVMSKMGHPAIDALPTHVRADEAPDTSLWMIFGRHYLTRTIASTVAYFGVLFTVYFMLSWTPKLLTELSFSVSGGILASLLMNLAGVVGCVVYGFAASAVEPRRLAGLVIAAFFVTTTLFGVTPSNNIALLGAVVLTGLCLFPSATALFVVVPAAYPSTIRSTGTGFAAALGRAGAISGPLVAGLLITDGWSRAAYCFAMAVPALIAAIAVYWIRVFDANATELSTEDRKRRDESIRIDSASPTTARSF
jgi:MFS transporter, AAHS family, vanillate permease